MMASPQTTMVVSSKKPLWSWMRHAAGRTARLGNDLAVFARALERVADVHAPAVAVAEVVLDLPVGVRDVDHDVAHAIAREVFDQVLEHRLAEDGDHRLGQVLRQRSHTGALPCGKNHGLWHGGFVLGCFVF
jgi:hypothetical protein